MMKTGKKLLNLTDMENLRNTAEKNLQLNPNEMTGWEDIDDESVKVKAIPDYDLSDPEKLVNQLVSQFDRCGEEEKLEIMAFLKMKFAEMDLTAVEESSEQLRDFIYEMF